MSYRLGIDIGGTFTDFALVNDETGRVWIHKQLTTPHDPSECVLEGMTVLLRQADVDIGALDTVAHGTTLITNAVIERKGAITGMLVTKGFRDVVDIAMERRYDLFDLRLEFAAPIVPRSRRVEVDERLRYDGSETRPLDIKAVREGARYLVEEQGIAALAICFLHAYADDAHERAAADVVREAFPDLYVSTSSDVLPFMREYERWSTTAINAYTQPMIDRYLARIEDALSKMGFKGAFLIMSSSGGAVDTSLARRFPVRLIESGPAAGVLMSAFIGELTNCPDLLSFDMGGTTAKGALVRNGQPLKKYEMEVAREHDFKAGSGLPVRVPVIDMIEIGAGGGSIADVDERKLLRVGPRSAGADPGPVCYGQGGEAPTLTDANVALGYLDPDFFLGGKMSLDRAAAEAAIAARVGAPLEIDLPRAAWGIHEVINEDVARAFRIHASELGFDYRTCSMVAFGGSGPVHALRIARKLQIPRVIFPAAAGVISAIGMLVTPLSFETLRSNRAAFDGLDAAGFDAAFKPLEEQGWGFLANAGVAAADVEVIRKLDMRYVGQGYEVEVELPAGADAKTTLAQLPELFVKSYEAVFSTSFLDQPLEIVNWKVEARGPRPRLADDYSLFEAGDAANALKGRRGVYLPNGEGTVEIDCPVYDRYALAPGTSLTGPAVVEEHESTCIIGIGDTIVVDERYNLIAELADA